MSRHIATLLTVAALALLGPGVAGAYTIDQENSVTAVDASTMKDLGFTDYSVQYQEFIPTLSGVDTVELKFGRQSEDITGVSVMVQILDATINGPVLGQTQAGLPGDLTEDLEWLTFSFPSLVSLTAGNTYLIRAENLAPDVAFWIGLIPNDQYPAGRSFVGTSERTTHDLAFREGLTESGAVPEPGSLLLMAGGLCCLGLWRRRKKTTA